MKIIGEHMRTTETFLCESEIEGGLPYAREYVKFEKMDDLISQLELNNPDLKEVKFTDNYLDKDEVSRLASALIKNTVLQKLMFVDMAIDNYGFSMALIPALSRNTSLICLVFNMVKIFQKTNINVDRRPPYEARHLDSTDATFLFMEIAASPKLECLVIRGGSLDHLGPTVDGALKKSLSLRKLDLTDNKITDIGLLYKTIESNTKLKILILADNKIGDLDIGRIAHSLQKNSTLEKLWVHGNPINNTGAKRLVDAMELNQSLRELTVSRKGNFLITKGTKNQIAKACAKNQKKFEKEKRVLWEPLNSYVGPASNSLFKIPYVLIDIIIDYSQEDVIQEERTNTTLSC